MRLICSKCRTIVDDVELDDHDSAEDKFNQVGDRCPKAGWSGCRGWLRKQRRFIPMVGNPPIHSVKDPEKLIYDHMMARKGGVVPVSLRRGLWHHIW